MTGVDAGQLSEYLQAVRDVYADAEVALARSIGRAAREVTDGERSAHEALLRLRGDAAEQVARLDERGATTVDRAVRAAGFRGTDLADDAIMALRRRPASDLAAVNVQGLDALARATVDRVTHAHRSILRTLADEFRSVVAAATGGILGGGSTQREAAQRAVWSWLDRGVTSFYDRSGRTWQLSSYAEMATRTAGVRAMVEGHLDRLEDAGIGLVYVSDHHEECALCAPWEGKVLTRGSHRVGVADLPSEMDDRRVRVDIVGTVAQARAAGLFHPNCRHSLNAYLPGVTEVPTNTEDPVGRKARQRQRAIERHIRGWKVREAGALDPETARRARGKVRQWQGAMRDHLEAHPQLRRLRERERPGAGFDPPGRMREDPDGPFPTTDPQHRRPAELTDQELEDQYIAVVSDVENLDEDRMEALGQEETFRQTVRDRVERRRQRDRDRYQRQRAEEERRRMEELDEVARLWEEEGMDWQHATERVTGRSVEDQQKDEAIRDLQAAGYRGRTFDSITKAAYRDWLLEKITEVENTETDPHGVRGNHLTREGWARGIDVVNVWRGNEAFARRWASEELKNHWDRTGGRPTLERFRIELVGDTQALRRLRGRTTDYHQ